MSELAVVAPAASNLSKIEGGIPELSRRALAEFWDELDVFQSTRRTYRANLARYESWLAGLGLTVCDALVKPRLVTDYKKHLESLYQGSTVQTYLIPIRRFYRWLSGAHNVPNPAANLKSPRTGRAHSRTALTKAEARKTVKLAEKKAGDGLAGLRDYALYLLLIACGLRTVEAHRADVCDLAEEDGRTVLYVQGKGHASKDSSVVLEPVVVKALRSYIEARNAAPSDPLFVAHGNRSCDKRLSVRSISKIAKGVMRDAGIDSPRLTAHSLRHTAVTVALQSGATVQEVQELARHANVNTTIRYAHNLEHLTNPAVSAAISYL